jgi:hypothetical protein
MNVMPVEPEGDRKSYRELNENCNHNCVVLDSCGFCYRRRRRHRNQSDIDTVSTDCHYSGRDSQIAGQAVAPLNAKRDGKASGVSGGNVTGHSGVLIDLDHSVAGRGSSRNGAECHDDTHTRNPKPPQRLHLFSSNSNPFRPHQLGIEISTQRNSLM